MTIAVRSVFYSGVIAILAVIIGLYIVSYLGAVKTEGEQITISIRSGEMASYVDSLGLDMPRVLDISTKRAIISEINEIDLRGAGLDNAQMRLHELMLNESIYGQKSYWMNATSVPYWIARVQQIGGQQGFSANITANLLQIIPNDAYSLRVTLNWSVNVTDVPRQARVFRNLTTSVIVPITGFEDPLYSLRTRGLGLRAITAPNMTVYDLTNVSTAASDGWYMPADDGPSFLDRLENSLETSVKYQLYTTNTIGLESFVNTNDLQLKGIETKPNASVADHLYFDDLLNVTGCPVVGTNITWLRLDSGHAAFYGVSITTC